MTYDDALWAAADRAMGRPGRSGETIATIERPVPHVGDWADGWREYAVAVVIDEGRVLSAEVTAEVVPYRTCTSGPVRYRHVPLTGGPVELTDQEMENVETDWNEQEAA